MRLPLVAGATVLAYAVLYAPQPLLPLFARRFSVSQSEAALLVTATLLPLSFAPLSYGYLLQAVAPARLLRAGVLVLAAAQVALAFAGSFPLMLALRFVQGLALPAVMTSLMTHVALSAGARVQRAMSVYVAASIVGGYLGRLLSGVSAAWGGWRVFFVALGAALFLCAFPLGRLTAGERVRPARPEARIVREVLREREHLRAYATAFSIYFVFAALLNFLPFRLTEIQERPSELWAGLVYTGYLLGATTALNSQRIVARLGGEGNALVAGYGVYVAALAATLAPRTGVLFVALFGFCGAMFFMHAVAAGVVNRRAGGNAGVVNGLYLVSYYTGGMLGSYLPGLVYERLGWNAFVAVLLGVAGAGLAAAVRFRRALSAG